MLSPRAPETPFVIGTLIMGAANVRENKGFTKAMAPAFLAGAGVVFLVSFTGGTRYAPIVRAFGMLFAIAAFYRAVRVYTVKKG